MIEIYGIRGLGLICIKSKVEIMKSKMMVIGFMIGLEARASNTASISELLLTATEN
jgi:hypothetical protein